MEAWVSEAALMVKLEMWTIQRVTNSKCRVDSYALRMHPHFWKTGKIKVFSFNNGRKEKEKKNKKKKPQACFVTCEVLILETRFLLEWSFLKPPASRLFVTRGRLGGMEADRRSLCGRKLLGLCPDPLLVVHPVLTEGRKDRLHFRSPRGHLRTSTHIVPLDA